MTPSEVTLFNQAVAIFKHGHKEQAYQQLTSLYNANPANRQDLNLLLWLAFTAPDLSIAEGVINHATGFAPTDPNVKVAQQWLATEKSRLAAAALPARVEPEAPEVAVAATSEAEPAATPGPDKALLDFKNDFARYCQDGVFSQNEWGRLSWDAAGAGLDLADALAFIREDAVQFIHRSIDQAARDGFVNYEEERRIRHLLKLLSIPPSVAAPLEERLAWLLTFTRIRQGEFSPVPTGLLLEPAEIAYFEIMVTVLPGNSPQPDYARKTATSPADKSGGQAASSTPAPVQMVASNRRLIFKDQPAIHYSQIAYIKAGQDRVELHLTGNVAPQYLLVSDPEMLRAALDVILRVSRQEAFTSNPGGYPEGYSASPFESNFLKAWQDYSPQQALVIELTPEYQLLNGKYRVDFAHVATRTAIELDGFKAHSSQQQIANDRRRERQIREAGWEFVRFGGQEISQNVAGCVAEAYHNIARRLARSQGIPMAAPERVDYRPHPVRILFVEEYALYNGKSFYSANSNLFYKTQEAFSRCFPPGWKSARYFLDFFKASHYYVLSLCSDFNPDLSPEEKERERNEALGRLTGRLNLYQPEKVIIVQSAIRPYIEKAIAEAASGPNIKLEVLPYPGKDNAEYYIERLVKIIKSTKK